MTSRQIEKIVHHHPFVPYRLVLTDGEEVTVLRPRKSHVGGDRVALVGVCRKPKSSEAVERFRLIHVDYIASAELLPGVAASS